MSFDKKLALCTLTCYLLLRLSGVISYDQKNVCFSSFQKTNEKLHQIGETISSSEA